MQLINGNSQTLNSEQCLILIFPNSTFIKFFINREMKS